MIEQTTKPRPPQAELTAEANVYTGVYRVLLGGMFLSTALFVIGIISALVHPKTIPLTPEWILQQYHWHILISGLSRLDPTSVMLVATAILILTPVARVIVSIYAFAVDHDHRYVLITGTVLAIMALALVLGLFGLK